MINFNNFSPILDDYIKPVIDHPFIQATSTILIEVVKIVAAKIFLEFLSKRISGWLSEISFLGHHLEVSSLVVTAPILEELFFRGFLLTAIHATQILYNRFISQRELTEEEELHQLTVRTHLSAFAFAAIHLTNPHETLASMLLQFGEAYVTGVSYAYLTEKYQTLSVTILAHGIHNALCIPIQMISCKNTPFFLTALIVFEIGVYILGCPSKGEKN
jgi:membrane protease YdiL (CAAX protease family)